MYRVVVGQTEIALAAASSHCCNFLQNSIVYLYNTVIPHRRWCRKNRNGISFTLLTYIRFKLYFNFNNQKATFLYNYGTQRQDHFQCVARRSCLGSIAVIARKRLQDIRFGRSLRLGSATPQLDRPIKFSNSMFSDIDRAFYFKLTVSDYFFSFLQSVTSCMGWGKVTMIGFSLTASVY